MALTPEELRIKILQDRGDKKREREREQLVKQAQQRQFMQQMLGTGLMLASGGAGLPGLLGKIPGLQKAMTATKVIDTGKSLTEVPTTFAKVMKLLSPATKTTRAGTAATEAINKMFFRGISDMLIPDKQTGLLEFDASQRSQKTQGYLGDLVSGVGSWKDAAALEHNPYKWFDDDRIRYPSLD